MGFFDWFSVKSNKDNADETGDNVTSVQDIQDKDEVHAESGTEDEHETEAPKSEELKPAETDADVRENIHKAN
ncbi:MAG: hypothetical protein U1D41_14820 [Nitrosomonas sp.]|jgi:hypothetical protein|uniref:hypothetical protein n=1 Tax=Nitrosomonas sp. TaxID=42353 RepID=UPI0027252C6E|nr:hypothetical protein [Nitrosomonas sp.]MDO8894409.1 hypothetical protein [Nitrosomonas sp.]MDP1549887.1 hypothetical protein [Nitrosomonas sp.]MDP1787905.1 hypothetical protein [Nitrosomonas sp.]MDP1933449.1 hypothetical protein [Nitrosomonas sp.]MDP3279517.1 hypothetical protein [Nitrosomonas sp.]